MAMHLVKRFGRLTDLVRSGQWADRGSVAVGDLAGSTLGVVGFGRIGQHTGTLGAALGMQVLAYDPVAEPPAAYRCQTLEELLSRSDVITLHLPLTPETHHLVDAETLAVTKRGAILVNCSRGSLIDNDAAYQALLDGQLTGIGLDVFDPEPPEHHPLFDHPDVVLTPHLMGLSAQATAATFTAAATGVVDVLEGRTPGRGGQPALAARRVGGRSTMKELLTGKVVLVSGGTQGLGAGIARAAAREGATVVIAGRNAEHGEQVVAELTAAGTEAGYVRADLTDVSQAVAAVRTTVKRHGRVDALVNSAGLTTRGTLLDTTEELFDQHIAVNLRAPFFLMQAAVADMVQRGAPGTIVNIISIDSHGGQSFLAPYVAAKAGLAGLTRNAAHAHRWDRVRINGLNIGWSATDGENLTQQQSHGAGANWQQRAAQGPADGQARPGRRDRRLRRVPALRPQRRRHGFRHRLGPERHRRSR